MDSRTDDMQSQYHALQCSALRGNNSVCSSWLHCMCAFETDSVCEFVYWSVLCVFSNEAWILVSYIEGNIVLDKDVLHCSHCSDLALRSPFFCFLAFTFQVFGQLNKFYMPSLFISQQFSLHCSYSFNTPELLQTLSVSLNCDNETWYKKLQIKFASFVWNVYCISYWVSFSFKCSNIWYWYWHFNCCDAFNIMAKSMIMF